MRKFNFNLKKNLVVSLLIVLAISLGLGLAFHINKAPKNKDKQVLSEVKKKDEVKVDEIKTDNEQKIKVPVINNSNGTEKSSQSNGESNNTGNEKTQIVPKKPEPPKEKPKTTDDTKNKKKVPTYPEKEVKPQKETTPKGGEKNSKGQVYFPGFGWVDDSGANKGENVTSDGDIDKQVGTMD
ncbi:DUF6550 family protein [Hathewaya limosa]|uniref:Multidrug efflux pump subunit AcrB n=1 Tax=Hathewaya limosa TaxID=1536 RepID=A0ABU0JS60_HATLI|nr:DUF6550 family protein [Hathewaya limosa]MDQ0479096.1 multidrug efflux pump subunit AcrB [Hathewaya limosa]